MSIARGLLLVFLFSFITHILAVKTSFEIQSINTYAASIEQSFGMAGNGAISIDYNVNAAHDGAYVSYVLILILTEAQRLGWYSTINNSPGTVNNICNQPSLFRQRIYGDGTINFDVTSTDRYSVLVAQCLASTPGNPIKVNVDLSMTNARPASDGVSHLPIQNVMYVRVLEGEVILYVLLMVGLVGQFVFARTWMRGIHVLFACTLFFATANTAAVYADNYYENLLGTSSPSLDLLCSILGHFMVFVTLSTLLFLSLGWSTLRAFVTDREKKLIGFTLGNYFVIGLANACCTGNETVCGGLNLATYVLKCLVYLGIIIAMNFTVTQLRTMLMHTPWIPTIAMQYARTKQFQVFRLMFIVYLLLPTAFLLIEATMFSWKEMWIVNTLTDLLDILMIFHVGATFGPLNEANIMRAFDGTFNLAATSANGHNRQE